MLKFTNRNLVQAGTIQNKSVSQISQVYALMNNIHTTLQNEKEKCSSEEKAQCQFLLRKMFLCSVSSPIKSALKTRQEECRCKWRWQQNTQGLNRARISSLGRQGRRCRCTHQLQGGHCCSGHSKGMRTGKMPQQQHGGPSSSYSPAWAPGSASCSASKCTAWCLWGRASFFQAAPQAQRTQTLIKKGKKSTKN